MVGHKLITKQTPKDGILVKKVMVAESVNIIKETYLCIIMDRYYKNITYKYSFKFNSNLNYYFFKLYALNHTFNPSIKIFRLKPPKFNIFN